MPIKASSVVTSAQIAPPELARILLNLDPFIALAPQQIDFKAVDIWGAGCLLVQMVAISPPFLGNVQRKQQPDAYLQDPFRHVLRWQAQWVQFYQCVAFVHGLASS